MSTRACGLEPVGFLLIADCRLIEPGRNLATGTVACTALPRASMQPTQSKAPQERPYNEWSTWYCTCVRKVVVVSELGAAVLGAVVGMAVGAPNMVGACVGDAVGAFVAPTSVGAAEGGTVVVGCAVVDTCVGALVAPSTVGCAVLDDADGSALGAAVGAPRMVGACVGAFVPPPPTPVGLGVAVAGSTEGSAVGAWLGSALGSALGSTVGSGVGSGVGSDEGVTVGLCESTSSEATGGGDREETGRRARVRWVEDVACNFVRVR